VNSFPEQKAASSATIRPKCKHTADNIADGVNFPAIRVISQEMRDILRYLFSLLKRGNPTSLDLSSPWRGKDPADLEPSGKPSGTHI